MVKVGIYDPYLDTLGGGEKYVFKIAECISKEHEVTIFWDSKSILEEGSKRFGYNLSKIEITSNIFYSKSLLKRWIKTRHYDLIIYLSDGSIPLLFSKKKFLIFQFPVGWVNTKNFKNRLKLASLSGLICYSSFVKRYLEVLYKTKIYILAPPVDIFFNEKQKKTNTILSVGRFTQGINRKKQEMMIEVFQEISKKYPQWELILAGGMLMKDVAFVEFLRKQAKNQKISIYTNVSFNDLRHLYQISKIYWHATGFGEDLEKHPEFAEHFGISTVEAMGGGAVPVVINAGGQKEIVENGKNGFLWNSKEELIDKTTSLIKDENLLNKISKGAVKKADVYSGKRFCDDLHKILNL